MPKSLQEENQASVSDDIESQNARSEEDTSTRTESFGFRTDCDNKLLIRTNSSGQVQENRNHKMMPKSIQEENQASVSDGIESQNA